MRALLVTVAGLAVAAAAPVLAEPPARGACHLVQDAQGDVDPGLLDEQLRPGPPSQALDVVGGDIAADKRTLTAVVRLRSAAAADAYSPTGYSYTFRFAIGTGEIPDRFKMTADIGVDTQSFTIGKDDDTAGSSGLHRYITGVVDADRREVRMSADLALVASLAQGDLSRPQGRSLYDFEIRSGTLGGDPRAATVAAMGYDTATSSKATSIGAASCVRIGS